jgi:phosphoribosyl 1,2-cyclic phosphodiesterase
MCGLARIFGLRFKDGKRNFLSKLYYAEKSRSTEKQMIIKTIASSSDGNCYIVEYDGYQLIIECGVQYKKIQKALDFDTSKVVGCLVSHEHGDHCKYLDQIAAHMTICSTPGLQKKFPKCSVFERFKFDGFWLNMNPFYVRAWPMVHDVECYAFEIACGKERLLYVTDTSRIDCEVKGLTHLMIESNYSFELLTESDRTKPDLARVFAGHLEIEETIRFIKRHKDTLQEIHLIHLSDSHSDEAAFKKRVAEASGVPVYIAQKG